MPTPIDSSFGRLTNIFADMIEQETQLVVDLLGTFRDTLQSSPSAKLTKALKQVVPFQLPARQSCGCDIPPPCWMPQSAGEVTSFVCAGATATVQIQITNCSASNRRITFQATGKDAAGATFNPAQLNLGPLERGTVSASITRAAGTVDGRSEVILWAQGCKLHYVRWTVHTTSRGGTCCHEVEIDDCPDLIHHWYDHFYCERPCLHDRPNRIDG